MLTKQGEQKSYLCLYLMIKQIRLLVGIYLNQQIISLIIVIEWKNSLQLNQKEKVYMENIINKYYNNKRIFKYNNLNKKTSFIVIKINNVILILFYVWCYIKSL